MPPIDSPQTDDRRRIAHERLAARARRITMLRRRVAAGALATFVLAWGIVLQTGSLGTTASTTASTAVTAAATVVSASDTTAVDDTATAVDDDTSAATTPAASTATTSSAAPLTTSQS